MLVIKAPDGIMYSEDPGSVKIVPLPLPLFVGRPTRVAGDMLILSLDQTQDIKPGLYNLRFDVSNPPTYPQDNTWTVMMQKDIEVLFSHVFPGYIPGLKSPLDLASAGAVSS